ncbi:putative bifunctional diguanylate cyclase/phosphodiesterase [Pseudonocardia sp.]|uniref:putative bifunctional diguanylate cyclase/phosphodiesterase n=1 Tax=Pseudonocardia sp. TaxID=60912 RepID=UPI003D130994
MSDPEPEPDPLGDLAQEWADRAGEGDPKVVERLVALLHRFVGVLAAEPFRPRTGRALGSELFGTGLCGREMPPRPGVEEVLAIGLGLLRRAAKQLGAGGSQGRRRLDEALDELALGFIRGLRDRVLAGHHGGAIVDMPHPRMPECKARAALLAALGRALTQNELRLVYQPLVRLADGCMLGAEALVRWQHPVDGLIGPGRFIRVAETSGLIVPLGRWVLAESCAQAVRWARELDGDLDGDGPYVSVNVSPVQLVEDGWVHEVRSILSATGLPPHRLQLEITEQAVLEDEASALEALNALRAIGVRLALDDFGTGYSSLSWLRRLPVQALKIDGSFVDGLRHPHPNSVDQSIVRALVDLAHALDLEVTAEWVETEAQARRLVELGCDMGQGRWFGDAGPGEWVPQRWRRTLRHGGSSS